MVHVAAHRRRTPNVVVNPAISTHTHNDFRGIFPQVSAVPSAANMHEHAFRYVVRITILATIYTMARCCATIIMRFYTCCCRRRFVGTVRPRGSRGFNARAAGQSARNSMRYRLRASPVLRCRVSPINSPIIKQT